jgi:hypothetical protein
MRDFHVWNGLRRPAIGAATGKNFRNLWLALPVGLARVRRKSPQ